MDRLLLETQRPASLRDIRELRHLVDRVLQVSVPRQSVRQQILLCLSEVTTNLVQHGCTGVSQIGLRFGSNVHGWWLDILDDGLQWNLTEQEPVDILSSCLEDESGRGIALVHSLCDRMDYVPKNGGQHNRLRLIWEVQKKQRPRVLVVEDDDALRRLYAAYLSDMFEIQTAANGQDALEKLKGEDVDLVLSDIRMPRMNGLSLRDGLSRARETELIPFIFLTAADNVQTRDYAASLGIDDYLVKPVDKTTLVNTIFRVLERSQQVYRQLTDRINRRITSTLSPRLPDTSHGWRFGVASRHTGVGGGDVLLHQDNEERLMLVLADIMGHDDSAKFFAYAYGGYLRGLMRTSTADTLPSSLLEQLSESALQDELLSQVTLTCCAATLAPNGALLLASAGHPAPLLISSAGVEAVPVGGMLPGLLPDTSYQSAALKLMPGQRIALYTDGLFESAGDESGRRQLEERIIHTLVRTVDEPLEHSLGEAMSLFDRLTGERPRDDALLMLFEPLG
ncbi:MAG: hypothetical protein B0D91_07915 [Oceanospirillales bacterium LUC14_002_19_P2]|nr:MAG: hypothetical protein B0D91_07915 [Oceanospirillales bacterium LUC14_002_19_P2]